MRWSGLVVGLVGLAVLDAIVSKQSNTANVSSWVEGAGSLLRRFLDPTVPALNPTTATASSSSSSSSGSSATTTATTVAAPLAPATVPALSALPGVLT